MIGAATGAAPWMNSLVPVPMVGGGLYLATGRYEPRAGVFPVTPQHAVKSDDRGRTTGDPFGPARVALAQLLEVVERTPRDEKVDDREAAATTGARRPVALALDESANRLYVGLEGTGEISLIDLKAEQVVETWKVGRGIVAVAVGERYLVAADGPGEELLTIDATASGAGRVLARAPVADPVGLAVDGDAYVVSRWARRVTGFGLDGSGCLRVKWTTDLPFPPKHVVATGAGTLIVSEAYGGRLAVLDQESGGISRIEELPEHSLCAIGLGPNGRAELLVAGRTVDRLATTERDDLHWGLLVRHRVRSIAIPGEEPPAASRPAHVAFPLGDVGRGAADPSAVASRSPDRVAVALAGSDELALFGLREANARRVKVGAGPRAVVIESGRDFAWTANTFDDSVSVADLGGKGPARTISLGATPRPNAVARGDRLFHSARLSHDGWMSCASCHVDGHTTNGVADTLGDGDYGAAKRIPSLLGVRGTAPFGWTGRFGSLKEQVESSITSTMRGRLGLEGVSDLVAYLETLDAPPAPAAARGVSSRPPSADRGRKLFVTLGCVQCHDGPRFTSPRTVDVGLADARGRKRFNPPSLAGLGQRQHFLHDGRARTLRAVFTEGGHPPKPARGPTPRELEDLLAYLSTL
ncbi:MAG: cytochrome C peroxidase [Planctomycetes bacterium]|nr:cytochrome C peroxidase [Planctomycetota bacterium]